jgi:uncharacterized protein YdeI (YjbR/CyaY-like superfamily)
MAQVIPDPGKIRAFESEAEFESWLGEHHDTETELWLRIYKKASDTPTITYAQALDVVLCWGWIDGQKKPFDEVSFLQRFTPRKARSIWSQKNCAHVERLTKASRMTPHGQVHINAAKADGRWDAAYAPGRTMEIPEDLLRAIKANPEALKTFQTLNRQNLYALAFRVGNVKTAATRAKKIETFVEMLARGETLYPNNSKKAASAQ